MATDDPEKPKRRQQHRERQYAPELGHPRSGLRQHPPESGRKRQQEIGKRQPQSQGEEYGQGDGDRLRQRVADCAGHERRDAWRRDDDGQQAGEERFTPLALGTVGGQRLADAHHPQAELVDAGEVQRDGNHQQAERQVDQRRLHLETPSRGAAGFAQCDQRDRDGRERDEDAEGVEDAARLRGLAIGARQFHETQGLHAQDGKHAGHQVQNDPAEESEEDRRDEPHAGGGDAAAAPATRTGAA